MDKVALVDLCKKGDKQALNLLYTAYSGKMMKICLRYVPDRQIAQDLLHDGFILIFTSIETLRCPDKLESWMGMIMKNISLRYLSQSNAAHTISLAEVEEWEEPADRPVSDYFPSRDVLLGMVERLPDGYRNVFKLAILEGLSHKEIARLLHIAPHSSSSQLSRAKSLLKKMMTDYRLILILLLLFLSPLFYHPSFWKKKEKKVKEKLVSKSVSLKNTEQKSGKKEETDSCPKPPGRKEEKRLAVNPRKPFALDMLAAAPAGLPGIKASASLPQPPLEPRFAGEIDMNRFILHPSIVAGKPTDVLPFKKKRKWKLMLAGSMGPQLTRSLYKLLATPTAEGPDSDSPQQVDTWEEYYKYLSTRAPEGTQQDSLELMNIAKQNSGNIREHRQHDAPVTLGLSFNKKWNDRWSIETGLQYTYLKSTFSTGEHYYIQEKQKIHYIGIPLRVSYRWGSYKRFSFYSAAGVQMDIPVKGSLQTAHVTDSTSAVGSQRLDVPFQWSVNASSGVQYHLTPHASIYLEPTINYYIPDGSQLRTIRKEHPLRFTIPVGIRFSW